MLLDSRLAAGPAPGIYGSAIAAWFAGNAAGAVLPLTFTRFAGGRSNLTYRVDDAAGHRWVLRRPPLGARLATAHDVLREQRVLRALHGSAVPVPEVVGSGMQGPDAAPFFVMRYVDGLVVRDGVDAAPLTVAARRSVSTALVDVLADLHAVDAGGVGLGGLGRGGGYVERQLTRWHRQIHVGGRELARLDATHDRLTGLVPEQQETTLVHGDFRLDNCVVDRSGAVVAVLDWELCTIGDPLADLGLLLVYWSQVEDAVPLTGFPPTVLDGFASRAELLARYAERAGRDVSGIGFYVALGYWKLACIVEGILARRRAAAMGEQDDDLSLSAATVDLLLGLATAALDAGALPSATTRRSRT